MCAGRRRAILKVSREEVDMAAAPELKPGEPRHAGPVPGRRERHLRLVPHHHPFADEEARRVSEARWVTALVAIATAAIIGLWTAALYGAADAVWWPFLLVGVFVAVAAFGVLVVLKTH
jgi:hypothetical protein